MFTYIHEKEKQKTDVRCQRGLSTSANAWLRPRCSQHMGAESRPWGVSCSRNACLL